MKKGISITMIFLTIRCVVMGQCSTPDTNPATVEIHQIDVGQADATFIKVNAVGRTYAILIDAGNRGDDVRQYIWGKKYCLIDSTNPYLDLVLLSHYDKDHLGGLSLYSKYNRGILTYLNPDIPTKDSIFARRVGNWVRYKEIPYYAVMDPGTYPGPKMYPPKDTVGPRKARRTKTPGTITYSDAYRIYNIVSAGRRVAVGVPECSQEMILIPQRTPDGYYPQLEDADLRLGGKIYLGTDSNNVPITLQLITSNGYIFSPTDTTPWASYDVTNTYPDFPRTGDKTKIDNNNYCLSWILEYGQFRYYSGGDLPGEGSGPLFDQETLLAERMPQILPQPNAIAGHVCAMKLNHHGSKHSTNTAFIDMLKPTATAISCSTTFTHPDDQVFARLEAARWRNDLLGNHTCAVIPITNLQSHKTVDSRKLLISGNKLFVYKNQIPQEITLPSGKVIPQKAILGTQANSALFTGRIPIKRGRSFLEEDGDSTGTTTDNINPFKKSLSEDEVLITKLVSNRKNGFPVVDGDFVIKVYPESDNGLSISDLSAFTITTRSPVEQAWMAPRLYNCHLARIRNTKTSK